MAETDYPKVKMLIPDRLWSIMIEPAATVYLWKGEGGVYRLQLGSPTGVELVDVEYGYGHVTH